MRVTNFLGTQLKGNVLFVRRPCNLFISFLSCSHIFSAPLSSSQLLAALVSSSHLSSNLLHSLRSQLFSAPKLDLSANPEKVPSLSFSKRHVKRNMKCAIKEKFSKNSSLQLWRGHFKDSASFTCKEDRAISCGYPRNSHEMHMDSAATSRTTRMIPQESTWILLPLQRGLCGYRRHLDRSWNLDKHDCAHT